MKSIIELAVESPRSVKLAFLVVLDFCVLPVLLWMCYAIRQFDLGAEVVPNLAQAICKALLMSTEEQRLNNQKALEYVQQNFDLSKIVGKWIELYES